MKGSPRKASIARSHASTSLILNFARPPPRLSTLPASTAATKSASTGPFFSRHSRSHSQSSAFALGTTGSSTTLSPLFAESAPHPQRSETPSAAEPLGSAPVRKSFRRCSRFDRHVHASPQMVPTKKYIPFALTLPPSASEPPHPPSPHTPHSAAPPFESASAPCPSPPRPCPPSPPRPW